MKLIFKILLFLLLMVLFVYFKTNTSEVFSDLVNILSISIGFTVTALSIVATSKFSKKLYCIETKDKSKTLLHELVNSHKEALILFFLSISTIIIYKFFPIKFLETNIAKNFDVTYLAIFQAIVWFVFCLAYWRFYRLIEMFCKLVIQNAKN